MRKMYYVLLMFLFFAENSSKVCAQSKDLCPNKEYTGVQNNHTWVDLGLPSGIKWATCNIGAKSPTDYGEYYAWGEIQPKKYYGDENYMYRDGLKMDAFFDPVRLMWHGMWRMPTVEDFEELFTYCDSYETVISNHRGRLFVGVTGNSIFLPAAGAYIEDKIVKRGIQGFYITSSSDEDGTAHYFTLIKRDNEEKKLSRGFGLSIRPVINQ